MSPTTGDEDDFSGIGNTPAYPPWDGFLTNKGEEELSQGTMDMPHGTGFSLADTRFLP